MHRFSLTGSRLVVRLALAALTVLPGAALAKTCELTIEGTDAMQFSTKELTVAKDCTEVKLTLKHVGKLPKASMGHNWVLTNAKDMSVVAAAGAKEGAAADFLPKDRSKVIAATSLVGGGESTSTTFATSALKPTETYKFFCTFPGHSSIMVGTLSVK